MTHDEMLQKIESLKTERGGWTRESLASLGVPWQPPKGWKKTLLKQASEEGVNETNQQ